MRSQFGRDVTTSSWGQFDIDRKWHHVSHMTESTIARKIKCWKINVDTFRFSNFYFSSSTVVYNYRKYFCIFVSLHLNANDIFKCTRHVLQFFYNLLYFKCNDAKEISSYYISIFSKWWIREKHHDDEKNIHSTWCNGMIRSTGFNFQSSIIES